jgi:hypothetical protein
VAIGCYSINGYFINGYCGYSIDGYCGYSINGHCGYSIYGYGWLFYLWLLVVILFMAIGGYSIYGY